MKRLLILFVLFLAAPAMACDVINTYDGACYYEPLQLARMSGPMLGSGGGVGGDPCGCKTTTYRFCYTGDHASGAGYACFTNGTASKNGTTSGVTLSVSSSYVQYEASNTHIYWEISADDGVNDELGTLFFSVYITDEGDANVEDNCFIEIGSSAFGTDGISIASVASTDKIAVNFESGDSLQIALSANTITNNQWYRIGISWDVANGKLALSPVTCGVDSTCTGITPSWTVASKAIGAFSSGPDKIGIGEKDSSKAVNDIPIQIKDLVVLSTYQSDDPW